ncbi:MAG: hypothetical protein M1352_01735 [Patescibacteria group bacterium]|nr:hypothetical protein [Patescibacteria group bacterium]
MKKAMLANRLGSAALAVLIGLIAVAILAGGYWWWLKNQSSTIIPEPVYHPVATTTGTEADPSLSYFNSLRLELLATPSAKKINVYLNTTGGELLDSASPHPLDNPLGKIAGYQSRFDLFPGGTLINDRLYVGFADQKKFYIGYISPQSGRAAVIPDNTLHGQDWSRDTLIVGSFYPSPQSSLIATTVSGDSDCSSLTNPKGHTAVVVFAPELSSISSPYWEDLALKPPPFTQDKLTFAQLCAVPNILAWSNSGKSLYLTWTLGGLGPPPNAGLAKIGLDGSFTDTGLPTNLTPLMVSPDERYILAAHSIFGFYDPTLYEITSKKLITIPYNELVADLRKKYGPDPRDRPGPSSGIEDFSFSPDSQSVFYSVWINTGPAGSDNTQAARYKVDVKSPTVATEVK